VKPKGIPQRKAAGLRPRLVTWKDHCLVISRSAALSPCPAETSKCLTPFIFLKSEGKSIPPVAKRGMPLLEKSGAGFRGGPASMVVSMKTAGIKALDREGKAENNQESFEIRRNGIL
jgi:hypothetical protein